MTEGRCGPASWAVDAGLGTNGRQRQAQTTIRPHPTVTAVPLAETIIIDSPDPTAP
jgi:hypothetical protein